MHALLAPWLWALFTVIAAGAQTFRNAMQRELTGRLGTVGATHVRFLFGLPFACLFLALVVAATGLAPPRLTTPTLAWTTLGGISQIAATALMLAAMRLRSFVVATAYIKTEPLIVALFGLILLGERPTAPVIAAILIATAGVLIVSWPKASAAMVAREAHDWRPAALGVLAAACFALSAVGFRGAVRSLDTTSFTIAASTVLVLGLAIQTALLTGWLLLADRASLAAIFRAWRPSLFAGFLGAFASQFWFLAFATATVAQVRTLALVEVIFAQILSRNLFRQGATAREYLGIALIVAGVALLLNG